MLPQSQVTFNVEDTSPAPDPIPAQEQKKKKLVGLNRRPSNRIHQRTHVAKLAQRVHAIPLPEEEAQFKSPSFPKSEEDVTFLNATLLKSFLFRDFGSNADDPRLRFFVEAMERVQVPSGRVIIEQNAVGDYLYVLEEGEVSFRIDNIATPHKASRGAVFGELALLYNARRYADAIADTPCVLWRIDQRTFRRIHMTAGEARDKSIVSALMNVKLFEGLGNEFYLKLADAMEELCYRKGAVICEKGERLKGFYLISSGSVEIDREKEQEVKCMEDSDMDSIDKNIEIKYENEFFGQQALLNANELSDAVIRTRKKCCIAFISKENFTMAIGDLRDMIWAVKEVNILTMLEMDSGRRMNDHEAKKVINQKEIITFPVSNVPFVPDRGLYVIRKGRIEIHNINENRTYTLKEGDSFGGNVNRDGRETICIMEEAVCTFLSSFHLKSNANKSLKHFNLKLLISQQSALNELNDVSSLNDLDVYDFLGEGAFGKTYMAERKEDVCREQFALKIQSKYMLIERKMIKFILAEKKVNDEMDSHPFVSKVLKSFHDRKCVYHLMELLVGGELLGLFDKFAPLDIDQSRFYSACVVEALTHLATYKVVHRDLKPENIMINSKGYCVLIDFGYAKIIENKSYTFCGSPIYLSPEVILNRGHNIGVDYWALGVILYEALTGEVPFYTDSGDPTVLFSMIAKCKFTIPEHIKNGCVRDLLSRLIEKNQRRRLGCLSGGIHDIREHEFYSSVSWGALKTMRTEAPWIPPETHFGSKHELNRREYKEIPSQFERCFQDFDQTKSKYDSDEDSDDDLLDCNVCVLF